MTNEGTAAFTADCGHVIPALPANHTGGTGYAVTKRYNGTEAKVCYACAATIQRRDMLADGRGFLYLCPDIEHGHQRGYKLTDWPGTFAFKPYGIKHTWGRAPNGARFPIVCGRFDFGGFQWSFRNAGDNQVARCKVRTRGGKRVASHGVL